MAQYTKLGNMHLTVLVVLGVVMVSDLSCMVV